MFASNHGALGLTFLLTRVMQAASMVAIIGMTANFVSEIVQLNGTPPSILVGVLSIVCLAVLYCAITVILYLDHLLPFLVSAIIDGGFLIALIVVSVLVGKPLSYLNCQVFGKLNTSGSSVYSFATSVANKLGLDGRLIKYVDLIGTSKATCLEMKSIWGLCIALCILFTLSAVSSICLWRRAKPTQPEKGEA